MKVKTGFEVDKQFDERVEGVAAWEQLSKADVYRQGAKQYVEAAEAKHRQVAA